MAGVNFDDTTALLEETVKLAERFEQVILPAHQKPPAGSVAYLTLVAERRFGASLLRLGAEHAYEGRVILRAMLEHYYNLAWILLRSPHRRANRFVRWLSLERLHILESLPVDEQKEYRGEIKKLRKRRTGYRRLYRYTDAKGRRRWHSSWAGGLTFADRVEAVTAAVAKKLGSKPFIYTLYKWFSSATHGNVLYLERLIKPTPYGGRPRLQPESHPVAIFAGAAVLVAGTIDEAARVLPFSNSMKEERQALRAKFDDYLRRYQAT